MKEVIFAGVLLVLIILLNLKIHGFEIIEVSEAIIRIAIGILFMIASAILWTDLLCIPSA